MYRLIKTSLKLLDNSDELKLSYLMGNKLKSNPKLVNRNTSYKGVFFRTAIFIRKLLLSFCLKPQSYKKKSDRVYIYSGTKNQYDSLFSTAKNLHYEGVTFKWIQDNYSQENKLFPSKTNHLELSIKVFISAIILFILKAPILYIKLIKLGKLDEIKYGFDDFCLNYIYIPYFVDEMSRCSYSLVMMSNDHNPANRCLNLIAREYRIKTSYLQHASISSMFPRLEFDYAFLDGYQAFEQYLNCEENIGLISGKAPVVMNRKVFLSGQKKILENKKLNADVDFNFGVAVNKLDIVEHVIECITKLIDSGYKVALRMHPAQNKEFITAINSFLLQENNPDIIIMNARDVSLLEYFSFVDVLFASNSSIHLEAALAGLVTVYADFGDVSIKKDYYGYVSKGLSLEFNAEYCDEFFENLFEFSVSSHREKAIREYSATYSTVWEGQEGKLVAETVKDILSDSFDITYNYFERIPEISNSQFEIYQIS